jgi:hypothetical protein
LLAGLAIYGPSSWSLDRLGLGEKKF